MAKKQPTPPVKEKPRNYKYGEKVSKTLHIRLTEKEFKKVMRKVGETRTVTQWFKKLAKL